MKPNPAIRVTTQAGRLVGLMVQICFVLACAALAVITCITVYEIMMRYFLNRPSIWVSDAVRYLLAAVIMLGLPELTVRHGHVSIDLISELLVRWSLYRRILFAIGAATCLFVSWVVQAVFFSQLHSGIMTQGLWPIPRFWITGIILTGFALTGLAFIVLTFQSTTEDE
ncbi:TRAP transporter small permease [Notoacmeibacter sp. MSK16QG-6]|uniref:TRAP transporter small permease n=1 Tax=Notoacmeibacter sp. MSK16QG-6 TaxID=2957982 RepID=UPI00209D47C5|nr:TRAP transporter small permease [Notoacmeibacter sp. MSK16QG-6]MCP1198352.1 TRAP transporter small permease subunit [Notoacmeibacter sp. MSK16QG-6]